MANPHRTFANGDNRNVLRTIQPNHTQFSRGNPCGAGEIMIPRLDIVWENRRKRLAKLNAAKKSCTKKLLVYQQCWRFDLTNAKILRIGQVRNLQCGDGIFCARLRISGTHKMFERKKPFKYQKSVASQKKNQFQLFSNLFLFAVLKNVFLFFIFIWSKIKILLVSTWALCRLSPRFFLSSFQSRSHRCVILALEMEIESNFRSHKSPNEWRKKQFSGLS